MKKTISEKSRDTVPLTHTYPQIATRYASFYVAPLLRPRLSYAYAHFDTSQSRETDLKGVELYCDGLLLLPASVQLQACLAHLGHNIQH